METALVLHVREDAPHGTRFTEHPESWDEREEYYEPVALIKFDEEVLSETERDRPILEAAYAATNNDPMGRDAGVIEIDWKKEKSKVRSTSVGDVIITSSPLPIRAFEVGSLGFRDITERNEEGSFADPLPIRERAAA